MAHRRRRALARSAQLRTSGVTLTASLAGMSAADADPPLPQSTSLDRAKSIDSTLLEQCERARDAWSRALASPEVQAVARALDAAAISIDECVKEAATITELPAMRQRLDGIRRIVAPAVGVTLGACERLVIGHAALRYGNELQSAAVSPAVKRLTCSGLARFADGRTVVDLAE